MNFLSVNFDPPPEQTLYTVANPKLMFGNALIQHVSIFITLFFEAQKIKRTEADNVFFNQTLQRDTRYRVEQFIKKHKFSFTVESQHDFFEIARLFSITAEKSIHLQNLILTNPFFDLESPKEFTEGEIDLSFRVRELDVNIEVDRINKLTSLLPQGISPRVIVISNFFMDLLCITIKRDLK